MTCDSAEMDYDFFDKDVVNGPAGMGRMVLVLTMMFVRIVATMVLFSRHTPRSTTGKLENDEFDVAQATNLRPRGLNCCGVSFLHHPSS